MLEANTALDDEALALVGEYLDYQDTNQLEFMAPYQWQSDFFEAGATNKQRLLMAANQVGKTRGCGAPEMAYHLTGQYPDDWKGYVFKQPVDAWALGVSGEQIRDNLQKAILGDVIDGEDWGKGTIPLTTIDADSIIRSNQTKGAVKEIKVRHSSGGQSTLGFRSYTQGQHALMGPIKDFILIDEEPEDPEIYPQCVTRTINGDNNKGGLVVCTFTPENGMTELVTQFMESREEGQYLLNVTWDDAPHLTEERKKQILSAIPAYQRDMRSKGIPVLGEGLIYPHAEDDVKCAPVPIPSHYRRLAAIDFGIDHPFGTVWMAYDPDTDTAYIYDCYRERGKTPPIHVSAIKKRGDIRVIYPHDGDNTEKGSGVDLIKLYKDEGLNVYRKFENPDGGNRVEVGIMEVNNRLQAGTLKIFSTCTPIFEEMRRYHRKNGKRVKKDDDLMDCLRYAVMSIRHAKPIEAKRKIRSYQPSRVQ